MMLIGGKTLIALFLIFVILLLNTQNSNANIHRAVPGTVQGNILRSQKLNKTGSLEIEEDGDEDDFTFFEKITLKANVSWVWAVAASLVVGSTGIFPLLIFRVEDGHSLKEASKFLFFSDLTLLIPPHAMFYFINTKFSVCQEDKPSRNSENQI